LLIFTDVRVEDIAAQGRDFNWERPSCPNGCAKVWGHGFVARIFATVVAVVLLRRYRCPTCGVVITLMPCGYAARYQTKTADVAAAIVSRLTHRGWPSGTPRQRGGHWLRKFLARCRMDSPDDSPLTVLAGLGGGSCAFL